MIVMPNQVRDYMAYVIMRLLGENPSLVLYYGPVPQTAEQADNNQIVGFIPVTPRSLQVINGEINLIQTLQGYATISSGTNYFKLMSEQSQPLIMGSVGYNYSKRWTAGTIFHQGEQVANGPMVFVCTIAGISANAGYGPLEQTTGIQDGSCVWSYLGPWGDLNFNNPNFAENETIVISEFRLKMPNASLPTATPYVPYTFDPRVFFPPRQPQGLMACDPCCSNAPRCNCDPKIPPPPPIVQPAPYYISPNFGCDPPESFTQRVNPLPPAYAQSPCFPCPPPPFNDDWPSYWPFGPV
jgi:hypothetical protein